MNKLQIEHILNNSPILKQELISKYGKDFVQRNELIGNLKINITPKKTCYTQTKQLKETYNKFYREPTLIDKCLGFYFKDILRIKASAF